MVNKRFARGWLALLMVLGLMLGLTLSCGFSRSEPLAAPSPAILADGAEASSQEPTAPPQERPAEGMSDPAVEQQWSRVVELATRAAALAQSAQSAQDWDGVTAAWAEAITALHAIPVGSPQRVFAQRKGREYVQNLVIAQQQAEQRSAPRIFPTFGSPILDEQIGLYLSYVATVGRPDVLVVGSSRALQGIDPQALQQGLAARGYSGLKVFNFSVNGATAQVMSFVLRQVLQPEQLPRLVIWADGSRAFNSARYDRTFASILSSPGYQVVRSGTLPGSAASAPANAVPLPISGLSGQGFLAVTDRFDPQLYYRQFPRVSGRYDDAYRPFQLEGVQTLSLQAVATYLRSQGIPFVLVNLPLSNDYLDSVRLSYERQFQQYLQRQANQGGFVLMDLLEQWRGQNAFFADPSHLNRFGAAELGRQLAASAQIPWQLLAPPANAR